MGDDSAITCHETLEASKTKLDLLKQEFDSVQGGIARCGDVQFKIKGWAITIFSAFVLIAVQHEKLVLLVACAGTVVLFWLLDSFYKSLQYLYIDRAVEMECLVNRPYRDGVPCFNGWCSFDEQRYEERKGFCLWAKMLKNVRRLQIALLYMAMLALLILVDWVMWSPWSLARPDRLVVVVAVLAAVAVVVLGTRAFERRCDGDLERRGACLP